jgi:hypothetical protein
LHYAQGAELYSDNVLETVAHQRKRRQTRVS